MGIDLRKKTRGFVPLHHMIIVPTILLVSSSCFLLAVIDFKGFENLDQREDANEVRIALITKFLVPMVFTWILAIIFYLLICCPNRIWYSIVSVLLLFKVVGVFVGITETTSNEDDRVVFEAYVYGRWAYIIDFTVVLVADFYMAVIFFILGFFYETDEDEETELEEVKVVPEESEESNEATERSEFD